MEHVQRHERAKEREMKRNLLQEMLQFIPIVAVQLIKEVVMKETKLIALEQIEIGMQYIKIESPVYTNMAASGKLHNFVHMMKTFYSTRDLEIFLYLIRISLSLGRRYFAILTKDFIVQVQKFSK